VAAVRPNPNPGLAIVADDDRLADPRGIRVALAPGSAAANLPPLVVEPPEVPVVPLTRVAGHGILGGSAPLGPAGTADGDVPTSIAMEQRSDAPGGGSAFVLVNGRPVTASLVAFDGERAILVRGADPATRTPVMLMPASAAGGARGVQRREVVVDGWRVEVEVEPAVRAALRERARRGREEIGESGPTEVHAIIPGVVVSVSVAAGDAVSAGQQLLVVEAMKMQNELRAPRDGTVERVAVAAGRTIEVGDLLLVLV
jgi:biotin carboxyl carrier protein